MFKLKGKEINAILGAQTCLGLCKFMMLQNTLVTWRGLRTPQNTALDIIKCMLVKDGQRNCPFETVLLCTPGLW